MQSELEDIAENHPNIYRECARAMLGVMHAAISEAIQSPAHAWGVMFAINHPLCLGRSISDVATQLKVPRATISVVSTDFCKNHSLPPSKYMRREEDQQLARNNRNKQLK